jgi:hypothetical protein
VVSLVPEDENSAEIAMRSVLAPQSSSVSGMDIPSTDVTRGGLDRSPGMNHHAACRGKTGVSVFHRALRCAVTAVSVLAVGLVGVSPAQAAAGEGSAYGFRAEAQGIAPLSVGPLALSKTEGPESSSLLDPSLPGVFKVAAMETSARHDLLTGNVASQAKASGVDISASLIGSDADVGVDAAQAQCSSTQAGTSGTASVSGLRVPGGQSVPDGAVNYGFDVGRGRMTVNEQIQNPDGGLTVNAAHLVVPPGPEGEPSVDIVIASATCGPATTPAD